MLFRSITVNDVICNWFFAVYIFTCIQGIRQLEAMPVVRCADDDDIDVFVFQHFPIIGIVSWFFQPSIFELLISTRSEEHTSELQSRVHLVYRLLLEKKNANH